MYLNEILKRKIPKRKDFTILKLIILVHKKPGLTDKNSTNWENILAIQILLKEVRTYNTQKSQRINDKKMNNVLEKWRSHLTERKQEW